MMIKAIIMITICGCHVSIDSSLTKVTRMTATLSYDRRAIDEDQAADFLAVLKSMLQDPSFLAAGKIPALRYKRDIY